MPAGSHVDVVIGVDLGTTSTKAVAFDADGAARAGSRTANLPASPAPGRHELDPRAVVDGALTAIRACTDTVRERGDVVAGLAFSAAMHSLVGLDADGAPSTPLLTWADARAEEEAERLRTEPLGAALHRRTGTPIHAMSPLLKLRWFADRAPETAAAVARWAGVKELVLQRLTGELVIDSGIASATGLLGLATGTWDPEALGHARTSADRLPDLVPTTHVLGLDARGAHATGLPRGTPVVVGSSDGALATLGLGAVRPGAVACSIGTSGALRAVADRPRVDDRGRVFTYVLTSGRWIVGGAVNNGGNVLDWLGSAVAPDIGPDAEALLAIAAEAPAGSGRLVCLPHLLGERAPHWRPGARGVLLGLTSAHRREHLLRAAIEGVCLQLALVLETLCEAGVRIDEVRATGGFSRSPFWRRMLASVLGRPIGFARAPEGSALGAALLGMSVLGLVEDLDRAAERIPVEHLERPDPADAALYARLLPIFAAAAEAAAPPLAALAALPRA